MMANSSAPVRKSNQFPGVTGSVVELELLKRFVVQRLGRGWRAGYSRTRRQSRMDNVLRSEDGLPGG